MKRTELKNCAICDRGMMHARNPLFYRIQIERLCVDVAAIQRQAGFEAMMGGGQAGAVLAHVMGPNEDLAKTFYTTGKLLICESCATEHGLWEFQEMLEISERRRAEHAAGTQPQPITNQQGEST